ncbi:MAG: hypothetical protein AB9846_10915 [Tenuifilaceae bacterium]
MKTKFLLSLLAIAGVMFVTSCEKDDPAPLSKEEATAALTSINNDFTAVQNEYNSSQGAKVMEAFDQLYIPFYAPTKAPSQKEVLRNKLLTSLKPALTKGVDDPIIYFNFPEYVGTWTYNATNNTWAHTSTPNDKVVLIFPFIYNGVSKTATVTYYDFKTGTFSGESYVSQLKFKVEVGGVIVYSWIYTSSQTVNSESASFEYTLGVFSESISYSGSVSLSSTSMKMNYTVTHTIKKNSETVYSTSATVTVSSNETGDYSMSINAQLRLFSIIIKWDIDVDENTNDNDPNNYMKMSVWTTGGAKVGDVKLIYSATEQDWMPYIYFADGTNAPVSSYFSEGLLDEIGDFMDSMFDFGKK